MNIRASSLSILETCRRPALNDTVAEIEISTSFEAFFFFFCPNHDIYMMGMTLVFETTAEAQLEYQHRSTRGPVVQELSRVF